MSEENNKSQNENKPRKFNQQQYDMLKRCSDKKDVAEWNIWRIQYPDEDIWLQGGNFFGWFLKGVYLDFGYFYGEGGVSHNFRGKVYLEGTDFRKADLENAIFQLAYLQGAYFCDAHLENANLQQAHLENADLTSAHLEGAVIIEVHLEGAHLIGANLNGANLILANLEGTVLAGAKIKNANFCQTNLQDANFRVAIANGETFIWDCKVNKHNSKNKGTNFSGVGLDSIRIDPAIKQLLKYNIRRMNWEQWYKEAKWWQWLLRNIFVRAFWWISDYGTSTPKIIAWFFGFAFVFAVVYRIWPGLVIVGGGAEHLRDIVHALYFSVVTMTTLGFGDIAANPDSHCGQILLMVQVILGYVMLGALITRLAVLFTGEGPAGRFADEKK